MMIKTMQTGTARLAAILRPQTTTTQDTGTRRPFRYTGAHRAGIAPVPAADLTAQQTAVAVIR